MRALAALPFRTPVVGDGRQRFNPIHATDLAAVIADCLNAPPGPGAWQIGGPEIVDQAGLSASVRGWLGLSAQPVIRLPLSVARALGRIDDALRIGPISATAVAQLEAGVLADAAPLLARIETRPRAFSDFMAARPAGTQDLWQARLFLMKPAIRLVLALMWAVSGLVGLLLPAAAFLPQVGGLLPDGWLLVLARGGGIVDLAIAAALLRNVRPRQLALVQMAVVLAYTVGLTVLAPALWADPFGGLLKNLPVLALLVVHLILTDER